MSIRVSVVVPTYRRPQLLERCLLALLTQNFAPANYEIIVVDDAASHQTQQQVEQRSQQAAANGHTLRYLPMTSTHAGPAAARNQGWRAAAGSIIAFTDDDCIPEMSWLSNGVAAFEADVVGISGRLIVPLSNTPTDYEYNTSQLEKSEFVTANCFYTHEILKAIGGFDERFTAAWREDSDLYFTLLERQAACIFVPAAVVLHPVRPVHWGISLSQQRKSTFNALLYKKHPALYTQRIQARPPWHYYCIVCVLLVLCLGIITASWLLTLVASCTWLYMTGRFCIQRLYKTSHAPRHIIEMIVTSVLIPPLAVFWRLVGMVRFRVFFL